MHYHMEVIMPPVDDVDGVLDEVLKPFNECDDDINSNPYGFYDFYVIGGRYSNRHLTCRFDDTKLEDFYNKLREDNVKCNNLVCGKQEIAPDYVKFVDDLFIEMFPEANLKYCPLFANHDEQYINSVSRDVCKLSEMPKNLTAYKCMIVVPYHNGELHAEYMIEQEFYNGVCMCNTDWDGKVTTAIERHMKRIENYKNEDKERFTPKDEWLVITVDYHI